MTEQAIQKAIIKCLEQNGAYVLKVIAANKTGIPDIVACYKGHFIAIEVKLIAKESKLSKLQKFNLSKIVKCGGISVVTNNVNDIITLLKCLD